MHADYLELSQALLHWSRRQPSEIAIKAELLAFGLELLSKHPDYIPLRRLIKMNAADLVTSVQHGDRRFSPNSGRLRGKLDLRPVNNRADSTVVDTARTSGAKRQGKWVG